MNDKLLPCPFCGCKTFDTLAESGVYMNTHGDAVARCGRPECAAEIIGPTIEFVRDAWNRRAAQPQYREPTLEDALELIRASAERAPIEQLGTARNSVLQALKQLGFYRRVQP